MAKLGRNELPANHSREDFDSFGPVATKDTLFSGCKLADMGCFKQDEGVDSNKYYFAAVVKSKKTGTYYMYVEYGRTKDGSPDKPSFQFTECSSEAEACSAFEKQCAEKNTKRGVWEKVGSKERYVPKAKKDGTTEDLYVVRYMASRAVGLPSAKNICNQDALFTLVSSSNFSPTDATGIRKAITKKSGRKLDAPTSRLFKDLLGGAVTYTKSTLVGGALPAISAIEDARDLLQDALRRVKVVGSKVENQVADTNLKKLTSAIYGMIPKVKPLGAAEDTWILSSDNIVRWQQDLDAFETALKSGNVEETDEGDIMQGIPADVENIALDSALGKYLIEYWTKGTRNVHGHGALKIHNLWSVNRHGDDKIFDAKLSETLSEMPAKWNNERPLFMDRQKERPDLSASKRKEYWTANVSLCYHGTRSVNVPGIIREGFRFPKELVGVEINGAALGPGNYQADDWGKSAHYCSTNRGGNSLYVGTSGHVAGRRSFMFACDVILGHPHVAPKCHGYTAPPAGHHCVFGKGKHTTTTWGRGVLENNEWVIYQKPRASLRYMAELSWY